MPPESPLTPERARTCRRCGHDLPRESLACESCHTLVYSERLDQLAAAAKALEAQGNLQQASERWLSGLALLPPNCTQAQWIQDHVHSLEEGVAATNLATSLPPSVAAPPADRSIWRRGFLRVAAFLSFVAFAAIYSNASGAQFGIGFATLILIHEMGHYVDIRRRGLPADMPIFLPGLGAYVRWRALGVSLETRAAISLAGPLAGFLSAAACAALWWQTRDPFWALLARVGAALNLLNLIPVWVLDGGQAALALSKRDRIVLLIASVLLWLVLRENVLLLVAAGALLRSFFTQDLPAHSSPSITAYFIAVLAALSVLLRMLPGQGFGIQ